MGLERAGVGFEVAWANDLEPSKKSMYMGHFGSASAQCYQLQDIRLVAEDLCAHEVPRDLDLAWASFPCTDLSLAGGREGLAGKHSGTFWNFTDILRKLGDDKPPVVALENVNGFATSHGGQDLRAAVRELNTIGYWVDVLTLDARRFVPQSRPRLFIVASRRRVADLDDRRYSELRPAWLTPLFEDSSLRTQRVRLPEPPAMLKDGWSSLVDGDEAEGVSWWDAERTAKFYRELSPVQLERVLNLSEASAVTYRTAYRRTRAGAPAWEIRADDIAGCLRTPRGGSSKQAVVRIEKNGGSLPLRVRWMTAREYAKLMGAGDYVLPDNRNQSIMGFGDAVCVETVRWLAEHYLSPLLNGNLASLTHTQVASVPVVEQLPLMPVAV
jgi:DNA (cytosine-5)-methyltransferase 1